ncbi:hypothetical protein BEH_07450 [Priestia filamentosa]|uniref:IDEAL domain-containing protein n=1 Tax=Priestia filamentosa TaxID=1402861 RepID=A0A0H4KUH1_9BACI|nr:hypothetical protein [Priestia filamentosa]AKO91948.1 hypothetical protein BEH_07450 [Priestia filamentosa]
MEVGEWVKVNNKMGFIVYKNHLETSIKVKFGLKNSEVFSKDQLSFTDNQLLKEDIHTLQLLALETNDKDWFEELGRLKMKGVGINGKI